MDTLIISASIGSGHTKAGEALTKKLKKQNQKVEHIDVLSFTPDLVSKIIKKSYNFLVHKTPFLWRILFKASNNKVSNKITNKVFYRILGLTATELKDYIKENRPNKIICTHFFSPSLILDCFNLKIETHTLITDYGVHQAWINPKVSKYLVAAQKTKQQLNQQGVPEEKIDITGIPTDPKFKQKEKRDKLLGSLNLTDQKTVLILSGGQGLAKIDNIIKKLLEIEINYNLIAVAGKNQKLEQTIKKINESDHIDYRPLGWTDQIDKYMKVSELVISKPGGMTTTECIEVGTPILAFKPIPGQEEYNAEYIVENNYGWLAKNKKDILEKTKKVISN